jgi:TolB-like protein/DNA-binding winged helix-turn-helix (wHTH) protein
MPAADAPESYQFDKYRLDPTRRQLTAGGAPVAISSRAFDLLLLLIQHRSRVVTREEIFRHVWPGISVDPSNLGVQMSALRRVLGDDSEQPSLITTVPGRGYRFIGAIESPEEAAADPAAMPPSTALDTVIGDTTATSAPPTHVRIRPGRRFALALAGLALLLSLAWAAQWVWAPPLAPRLSIVVLPFRNLSDDRGKDYLADAITDDLTTDLTHIPGSMVIARETADSYRGHPMPVQKIGQALHVRYSLEGSVREVDKTLHVNAQLIDAASGTHLLAQRFEIPSDHIGEAQDIIVRRIASALDVALAEEENTRALRERPNNPDALDLFNRARSIVERNPSLAGLDVAQHVLERALVMQPKSTDLLTLLGKICLRKVLNFDDPRQFGDYAEARTSITQALEASPQNPEALALSAEILFTDGQNAKALAGATTALTSDANNTVALDVIARSSLAAIKLDEAASAGAKLLQLNPLGADRKRRLLFLAYIRLLQHRYAEAIDLVNQATAGDPDPAPGAVGLSTAEFCRLVLIAATELEGNDQSAKALYQSYKQAWPNRTVWRLGNYYPKPHLSLASFAQFMSALHSAGMPLFANETLDTGIPPTETAHEGEDFDPTPSTVAGAGVIAVKALAERMHKSPPPIVIDLGSGRAVPPGAIWHVQDASDDAVKWVREALQASARTNPQPPIIVMGDGTFGWDSYNMVLRLIHAGYAQVIWFRGGEEAWSASGLPSEDRRGRS